MLEHPPSEDHSSSHFVISKKKFWGTVFILLLTAGVIFRNLFLQGLYIGFAPPRPPAPPLSQELITRLNALEDKLNKSIHDVNDIYSFKEKLVKQLPNPTKKNTPANFNGKGGQYLPLNVLNLASQEYDPEAALLAMQNSIDQINSSIPYLRQQLTSSMYLYSNLPEGVPLIGPYTMTSGFGDRSDPFTTKESFHPGVDFAADIGTPVVAAANGIVSKVDLNTDGSGYGNYIDIAHKNGIISKYGHLSEVLVSKNDVVKRGDLIGLVGNTGRSTGPHLHFEVQASGVPIDPMDIISPLPVKPNQVARAPYSAEVRSKCANLLLLVKDSNSSLMKECLASGGKKANELLIAKQAQLKGKEDEDLLSIDNTCRYIDKKGNLVVDTSKKCLPSSKSSQ